MIVREGTLFLLLFGFPEWTSSQGTAAQVTSASLRLILCLQEIHNGGIMHLVWVIWLGLLAINCWITEDYLLSPLSQGRNSKANTLWKDGWPLWGGMPFLWSKDWGLQSWTDTILLQKEDEKVNTTHCGHKNEKGGEALAAVTSMHWASLDLCSWTSMFWILRSGQCSSRGYREMPSPGWELLEGRRFILSPAHPQCLLWGLLTIYWESEIVN